MNKCLTCKFREMKTIDIGMVPVLSGCKLGLIFQIQDNKCQAYQVSEEFSYQGAN